MIDSPGAKSERNAAAFEKYETSSVIDVEPTLTAEEIHPGDDSPVVDPLLPAAITVAMPMARRLSMIGFVGSSSHGAVYVSLLPRLMLTAAILRGTATAYTRSRPAMMSDENAARHGGVVRPHVTGSVTAANT